MGLEPDGPPSPHPSNQPADGFDESIPASEIRPQELGAARAMQRAGPALGEPGVGGFRFDVGRLRT